MDDYLNEFVSEGKERITDLNNALLDLENDPSSTSAMEDIFRTAHTLKGNFAAMGYKDASDLAHAIEDLLDEIRQGDMSVTPDIMDAIFRGVDEIETILNEIADTGTPETDPSDTIHDIRTALTDGLQQEGEEEQEEEETGGLVDLADTLAEKIDGDADGNLFHVRVDMSDSQMKGVDALFTVSAIERKGDILDTIPDRDRLESGEYGDGFDVVLDTDLEKPELEEFLATLSKAGPSRVSDLSGRLSSGQEESGGAGGGAEKTGDTAAETPSTDTSNKKSGKSQKTAEKIQSIRINVDQLDILLNRVEELVTTRIKLRQAVLDGSRNEAEEELNELDKIASGLQDTVMDMRLVPIKKVIGKFPRMVRDIARAQEKKVNFEMEGEDIELDRTVLNEIGDPLMHLLRNAIDHGLEQPENRVENGKAEQGTVKLICSRERDKVTIKLTDDGRGIDAAALRNKAVEKGVVTREEADALTDADTYDLIFSSGFSTADEVTDVSGRGVGMDVVKTTITRLDGSIDIDTEMGKGTTVTLTLPVTVAIVRVLLVGSGPEKYGIPLKYVEEITRKSGEQSIEGEEVVVHEDKVYPVIRLAEALDVPNGGLNGSGMLIRVIDSVRQVAVCCDSVIGQEEVVVKPFEGILSGIPGVSGAAILGQGDVVPILDIETL